MNNRLLKSFSVFFLALMVFGLFISGTALSAQEAVDVIPNNEMLVQHHFYLPMILVNSPAATPVGPVGGTFTKIVVDPANRNRIFGGHYGSGVFESLDRGRTWYERNLGLGNRLIQSLAMDPGNSEVLYAGTAGSGLFKSINGGRFWIAVGADRLNGHVIYDIEIDPRATGTIYVSTRLSATLKGSLFKSTDAGNSWIDLNIARLFNSDDYSYDVDLDPQNSLMVYLSMHEHGIYKSPDGGINFTASNEGLEALATREIAIDRTSPSRLYTAMWKVHTVARSTNAGASWNTTTQGFLSNTKVLSVVIDPLGSTANVYALTYGKGLFTSPNYGINWYSRGLSDKVIYDFNMGSGNPPRWYVATGDFGMLCSDDQGQSWSTIMADLRLSNIGDMVRLMPDKDETYIAVFGQGVYRVSGGGEQWLPLNSGLSDLRVSHLFEAGQELYAMTGSGLARLVGDAWEAVPLPELETAEDVAYLAGLEAQLSLPEGALSNGIGTSVGSDAEAQSQNLFPLMSVTAGLDHLWVGSTRGLWQMNRGQWQNVDFVGEAVSFLKYDGLREELWLVKCAENKCDVLHGQPGRWLEASEGFENGSVFDLKLQGDQVLLSSDQGLLRWDASKARWLKLADCDADRAAVVLDELNPDRMGYACGRNVFFSGDRGNSWSLVYRGEREYNALSFVGDEHRSLLLGSHAGGAYLLTLEK